MNHDPTNSQSLATEITKAASKQTYYTIRLFADRDRVADAYRAYGYFRWVDDVLDAETGIKSEKMAFFNRQKSLLAACYRDEIPDDLCAEEWMLVDLVGNDCEKNSGLQSYLCNMMAVMEFDAERRGRIISQAELSGYSRALAVAVTEALYYFIGHDDAPLATRRATCPSPLPTSPTCCATRTKMLQAAISTSRVNTCNRTKFRPGMWTVALTGIG